MQTCLESAQFPSLPEAWGRLTDDDPEGTLPGLLNRLFLVQDCPAGSKTGPPADPAQEGSVVLLAVV